MSLTLNLLTFSKRENSTKVPSSAQISGGRELSVLLKDATSVYNPTFVLRTSDPHTFNYAYCPDFGKYYFIRDWVSDHDLWNCICEEDVLATFRSQIRSSSQYVLRASARWNDNIVDNLYPTNVNITYQMSDLIYPFGAAVAEGYFVISVLSGENVDKIGALDYYYMTSIQFKGLMMSLMGDDPAYFDIDTGDLSYGVQKALVNPIQYITECYWIPYLPGMGGTSVTSIKVGWWEININATRISSFLSAYRKTLLDTTMTLPKHPLTATRGRYLNTQPYTFYTLWSQIFGSLQLDANMLTAGTALRFNVAGDLHGSVCLRVSIAGAGTETIICTEYRSVKVPLAIGQINNDPMGFMNSIASTVNPIGGLLQGDIGGIAGTVSGITGAIQSMYPKASGGGSNGSMAAGYDTMILQCEFHYPVDEDIPDRGRPLCERAVLSTLGASATASGYVLCSEANISTSGTKQEDQQIVNYLNAGAFIE